MKSASEHLTKARRYYVSGNPTQALSEVEKALAIRERYYLAHILRGEILYELDQDEGAKDSYDRAIEIDSQNFIGYVCKADFLLTAGLFNQAERLARRALRLLNKKKRKTNWDLAMVYDSLANALVQQSKLDAAVRVLQQGFEITHNDILEATLRNVISTRNRTSGG